MTRAYFGHHKCASTWIRGVIEEVFREIGLTNALVLDPLTPSAHGKLTDYHVEFDRSEIGAWLQERKPEFTSFLTADQEQVDQIRDVRAFHVIRDPRDILVSAYFSHRNSHPTEGLDHLAEHREKLKAVQKDEGLFLEMEFSACEVDDLRAWNYNNPGILELKMEILTTRSYEQYLDIFRHLDLLDEESSYLASRRTSAYFSAMRNRLASRKRAYAGLRKPTLATPEMVLGRVYDHRFERLTGGRKRGTENDNSHYRKGVSGDWKNHFTRAHCEAFLDRFEDVLQVTGYEQDDSWVDRHLSSVDELGIAQ